MQLYTFDEAYLARLREGDAPTESHFVAYFSRLLHIKLRAQHVPAEVADDICQKTLAQVICSLRSDGSILHPNRLGTFVNSVCNKVFVEHYPRTNTLRMWSIYLETYRDKDGDWLDDNVSCG